MNAKSMITSDMYQLTSQCITVVVREKHNDILVYIF